MVQTTSRIGFLPSPQFSKTLTGCNVDNWLHWYFEKFSFSGLYFYSIHGAGFFSRASFYNCEGNHVPGRNV